MTGAANPEITSIRDFTNDSFHVELSHEDGWDFIQIASVNSGSQLRLPADDAKDDTDTVPFNGWRVTLRAAGIDSLIDKLGELKQRVEAATREREASREA